MALTLLEAAKQEPGKVIRNSIIEMYAGSSGILSNLPFDSISGNALGYNREGALPGVGFRGVNEAYTASTGILNPLTETLVIAGGDLDVDKFILDTQGMNVRSTHEAMKVRALSLAWTSKFFNGDTSSDPREFDGLKVRITGSQKIQAGTTANGTALSLAKMDEAIDQTLNPTHIIMNKGMARRFAAAARLATVGGYIQFDIGELGKRPMSYNGIPIITVDLDNAGSSIISNTEACTSGTATGTSIYIVSFGNGMFTGIQNGSLSVRDLGELQTSPLYRTRVEWYCGIAIYNGRAATRLWSIADSAITA
jgi:hypothetical protein